MENKDATQNMNLWNSVCITDPKKVKPITGKSYKGSSPSPYWLVQRATEVFGPCGDGWGIEIIEQGFQSMNAETMLHSASIRLWYMKDGRKCSTEHIGGTLAMYKTNAGKMIYDDDAPKKSVTDAMVKALSFLGFAGDIFSGRWDDWKYQEFANEHHNGGQQQQQQQQQQQPQQQQPQQNNQVQQQPAAKQKRKVTSALQLTDEKQQSAKIRCLENINKTSDANDLNAAIAFFKDTAHEGEIRQACNAKADREGWSA